MSIYDVNKLPVVIPIGVQTENGVEPVGFDIRAWQDVWDDIKVNVWLTRPGEDAAYPAADTELVGTVLYWYPSEADTAIHGNGKVELLGLTEDKRKLSGWCETNVRPTSLATTQEMPEAVRPWVDQVMLAAAQAEAAVEKMPSIGENGNWHAWDANAGEYVDTGKPSRGEQGLQGIQGIPGQQGIQGERGLPGERGLTGERGPAGNPGKDGTSVTVANVSTSSEDGGTNTVTFSDGKTLSVKNGSKGSTGATGATGPAGSPGKDGTSVTVASVSTSNEDGGTSTVTFSDGKTLAVKNGSKGSQGIQGIQGIPGPAGSPGKDGRDGVDGDTRVYIGSDEPPEDAELWVDPEGTVNSDDLPQASEENAGVVMLDATLTKQGAAADAKAVGDKVAELTEEIAKLPQGGGGAAVQPDWSVNDESDPAYVKNRTHWVELSFEPIVWDGSTDGRDFVDIGPMVGEEPGVALAYKVINHVLTKECLEAAKIKVTTEDMEFEAYTGNEITDVVDGAIWVKEYAYISPEENYYHVGTIICTNVAGDFSDTMGVVIPSVGTYLFTTVPQTVEITDGNAVYHKIDSGYLPKLIGWVGDVETAEVFNDKEGNVASGNYSHAEGYHSHASGDYSHAEGYGSHAEGDYSHAEGNGSHAEGNYSHVEGDHCHAKGSGSHAEGKFSRAEGSGSHAEGEGSHAKGKSQHVQGEYNIVDPDANNPYARGKYAHIVGNGKFDSARSNAHTLDWDGNAWFAGGIELTSPNGTRYRFTVSDDGTLAATAVTV